jgi:hypothetical protein
MQDQELIDGLVATYRTLNIQVRPQSEETLRAATPTGDTVRAALRRLRDDELKFSQALKMRVTAGHPITEDAQSALGVIGTESEDDTTAALIAQFGTARESTLAMLRGLPDPEWDSTTAGPRTIRQAIRDLVANDQRHLEAITAPLAGR